MEQQLAECTYVPCSDCHAGKHQIRRTINTVHVRGVCDSGEEQEFDIPGDTVYLRVDSTCYIPTMARGDTIPDGHDKPLTDLWDEHGLMSFEWDLPYG